MFYTTSYYVTAVKVRAVAGAIAADDKKHALGGGSLPVLNIINNSAHGRYVPYPGSKDAMACVCIYNDACFVGGGIANTSVRLPPLRSSGQIVSKEQTKRICLHGRRPC